MFLLHIGYPKAASSTLQNGLFSRLPNTNFFGKSVAKFDCRDLMESIKEREGLFYEPSESAAHFQSLMATADQNLDHYVISDEDLTTASIFNRRMADRKLIAERIKEIINPDEILIVLRSQFTAIPALYATATGSTPSAVNQATFERMLELQYTDKINGLFSAFDYDKVTTLYEEVFGREHITVLTQELLVSNPREFYTRTCHLMGLEYEETYNKLIDLRANTRSRLGSYKFTQLIFAYESFRKRWGLQLRPSKMVPFWNFRHLESFASKIGPSFRPKLTNEWMDKITDYFAHGNSEVEKRYNLNLADYNYPIHK